MNIEELRLYCLSLPGVEEDVKWDNTLCFMIFDKMFFLSGLDNTMVSLKSNDEEFEELLAQDGFEKAPYLGRYLWIHVDYVNVNDATLKKLINTSYQEIKSKLPKSKQKQLEL